MTIGNEPIDHFLRFRKVWSRQAVFRLFRIEEPVAKGIAIGSAAHAIGTAKAMELGEVEGAMSSLSIAVAGLLTVIGASLFAGFY